MTEATLICPVCDQPYTVRLVIDADGTRTAWHDGCAGTSPAA